MHKSYISILLLYCLTIQSGYLNAEADSVYPEHWGQLSTKRFKNTACPAINGFYKSKGYSYKLVNGTEQNITGIIQGSFLIPSGKVPNNQVKENSDEYINSFLIKDQSETGFIVVRLEFVDSKNLVSYIFEKTEDRFNCKDGWIVYEQGMFKSNGEWHSSKSSTIKQFTNLKDGSLLVKVTEESYTTRLFMLEFSKKEEVIIYARFEKENKELP